MIFMEHTYVFWSTGFFCALFDIFGICMIFLGAFFDFVGAHLNT